MPGLLIGRLGGPEANRSIETYAKAKPERLRAAADAVSEQLAEAIAADSCCTYVAQAVGAESEVPADEGLEVVSAQNTVVALRGFEPRFLD